MYAYKDGYIYNSSDRDCISFTKDFETSNDIYVSSKGGLSDFGLLTVNKKDIFYFYRANDYNFYLVYSQDGETFEDTVIDFIISQFITINNYVYALEKTNIGVNIYKWDQSNKIFILAASHEGLFPDDFIYDEATQKLYTVQGKNLIIFDGTYFSETEFLPDFEKKLIAISKTHYLFMTMKNNEYLSVKRDDKFLPIISDEDETELNTWSAKKISEEIATETSERKTAEENLQSQMLRLIRKEVTFTIEQYYAWLYPSALGLEEFDENAIIQITANSWDFIIYTQDISKTAVAVRFVRIDSAGGNSGVTLLYKGNVTGQVKYVGK